MTHSDAFDVQYKGAPAKMYVIRNSGECWGRLVTADAEYDVTSRRDWYDHDDARAAAAFARAAGHGSIEEPQGWIGEFEGPK